MKIRKMENKKHFKQRLSQYLLVLGLFLIGPQASAFVPIVYEPNPKELKETALSIGRTAIELLRLGQPKEGKRLAQLAVQLNPKEYQLWIILAETEVRNGSLKQAIESINKAKKLNSQNANLFFFEGSIYIQQNNLKKAIAVLEKGLSIEPKNPEAYFNLGNAKTMQMDFKSALVAYKKAYTIKVDFWQAINNKGLVLYELNKKNKAIEAWRETLKIKIDAEPLIALAAALEEMQPENAESIELVKQGLKLNPNYVSYEFQKEQLWGSKLRKAAQSLFLKPSLSLEIEKAFANSNMKN